MRRRGPRFKSGAELIWRLLGVGADVQGRITFAIFVIGAVAAAVAGLHERVGVVTAVIVVAALLVCLVAGIVTLHAVRADEQRIWERKLADAQSELARRIEDEKARTEARVRGEMQAAVDFERGRAESFSRFGILVPASWNAIVTGQPNGDAQALEIVPPGCTVVAAQGPISDDRGNSITGGQGNRIYNGTGVTVAGVRNVVGKRPY